MTEYALLALADPHLKDRNVRDVIYALAIKRRLNETTVEDEQEEEKPSDPAALDRLPPS